VGNPAAEQQKYDNANNQEMPEAETKHEMLFRDAPGYVLALPPKPAPTNTHARHCSLPDILYQRD